MDGVISRYVIVLACQPSPCIPSSKRLRRFASTSREVSICTRYPRLHTGEQAIAGITSGLIGLYETVTWRAKHFGLWLKLTSKITAFDPPRSFTDEMIQGPFKLMHHQHIFEEQNDHTLMTDIFRFESPLGILGKLVNVLILKRYMQKLLEKRNEIIKATAEMNNFNNLVTQ